MRFLRKNKVEKTIIVISDLHLGAGTYLNGKKNFLEDFHYDKELVEFLEYYSKGEYQSREVELIINGDFLDFLAVPFVKFFDDEFWSEEAAVEKFKLILDAHKEVMDALVRFMEGKKRKLVYILGNHDAEMVFPRCKKMFFNLFPGEQRKNVLIRTNHVEYTPVKGIVIKHGHEYESAHQIDFRSSIVRDENGRRYFLPPWGSYYVTRVINRFKEERDHVNLVRPIKRFLINGLIYDTLFTMRFMFANAFYWIMVRFISLVYEKKGLGEVLKKSLEELELFQNYEDLTEEYILERDNLTALIMGHTHGPVYRSYANGALFVNTGTWCNIYRLDFSSSKEGDNLTYAQINVPNGDQVRPEDVALNVWKGKSEMPFVEFS